MRHKPKLTFLAVLAALAAGSAYGQSGWMGRSGDAPPPPSGWMGRSGPPPAPARQQAQPQQQPPAPQAQPPQSPAQQAQPQPPAQQAQPQLEPAASSIAMEAPTLQPSTLTSRTGTPFGPIPAPYDPFGATPTYALTPEVEERAGAVRVGPMRVYPAIGVSMRYDDNIFFSNAIRRESWVSVISPAVRAETRTPGGHTFGATYRADIGRYFSSSADNYDDQTIMADANVVITSRARLTLRTDYLDLHEARGSTDRPAGAEPDRYHAPSFMANFAYGAPGAQGRLELETGRQNRRYENNRSVTILSDRDTTYVMGTFNWRAMPATTLLLEARHTDIDYKSPAALLDSTENRLRIGANWEATAATTVIGRVGVVRKNFDSPLRENYTGPSWQGTVRWAPRTYSVFEFTTAGETYESTGVGDFILSKLVYGSWVHNWNSRLRSNVLLGFRNDDFKGVTSGGRSDDTTGFGGGFSYEMQRWLHLSARYIYTTRSSNAPTIEYDRNLFMLSVSGTL